MKRLLLLFVCKLMVMSANAQCNQGEVALTMNIFTDPWGYETYWEIVPAANPCGVGTVAWGSNIETVGCSGGGEQNANGNGYPNNTIIQIPEVCLTEGEFYTLYFVDDYGDGGLSFELFEDGSYTAFYVGTGIGNSWTFQAGNPDLPEHDSPCNAEEIFAGEALAIEVSNIGCVAQMGEIYPPQGACQAIGFWCDDAATKTVWAKFVVPDEGAYEISTCNNGTSFDTQMAVWIADNCSNMQGFQLVSANDDSFGGCSPAVCAITPPVCVDQGSAAYTNVIGQIPSCCSVVWDNGCQSLYDTMSETCLGGTQGCYYTLNGYDTYGDGWNDGFVTVTINGVPTNYTFYTGFQESWLIAVNGNETITLSWSAGGWPEEVSFQLLDAMGNQLFFMNPTPPQGVVYSGTTACQGSAGSNPGASSCFVSCLPAGTVCYIQIDGYQGQTGKAVLSVKPYTGSTEISAIVSHTTCPGGFGLPSAGSIIPQITGWGTNYTSSWTGPNGFVSDQLYLPNLNPGDYTLNATNDCGEEIIETFTILGPDPFFFENNVLNACTGLANGAVEVIVTGGTEPYDIEWWHPDGEITQNAQADSLASGIYYMFLTDSNECSIIQAVEVPEVDFPVVDLGQDLMLCTNYTFLLQGPTADTYLWSNGSTANSLLIDTDQLGIGAHEIWLTATNNDGCSAADSILIIVETCLSQAEELPNNLVVFPNPATNWISIMDIPDTATRLNLINAIGVPVYNQSLNGESNLQIDISHLPAGLYVVNFFGNSAVAQRVISKIR